MRSRRIFGFLSLLTLLFYGFYRFHRQLLGRWLRLRAPCHQVIVRQGLRVLMPDGISLATDHYAPRGKGLFPTLLIRTPYGRNRSTGTSGMLMAFVAQRFAERGYNVVVQDVRGRFDSLSEFEPFVNEAVDGRATLEWIQTQPWFNGLLGTWGPSYLGYVQWAIAPSSPLYLKAMLPAISGSEIPVLGIRDRAFNLDTTLRWIVGLGAMERARQPLGWLSLRRLSPAVQDRIVEKAASRLPLESADQVAVGKQVDFYRTWLANPSQADPYWKPLDLSQSFESITALAHLVGGWYDIFLRETLSDYTALRKVGRQPHLTIGPWSHLSPSGFLESFRQGLLWFDAHLKGDHRCIRQKPVRIYVMGGVGWKDFDIWPPPVQEKCYYLRSPRALSDHEPDGDDVPDRYTYDPRHPTPSVGGYLMSVHAGSCDNRTLEARPDVLTFTASLLEEDLVIIGAAQVTLYVHSTLEHTDFFARLCDVLPDGRSLNICDGFLRLEPGVSKALHDESLCIQIDLWPTAYRFKQGHRIRLQISSGAHPRWSRNLGCGESLGIATMMHSARQTVYHDRAHPSALLLPVPNRRNPLEST